MKCLVAGVLLLGPFFFALDLGATVFALGQAVRGYEPIPNLERYDLQRQIRGALLQIPAEQPVRGVRFGGGSTVGNYQSCLG